MNVGNRTNHPQQTHCKYGHEFTQENTYVRPKKGNSRGGKRMCRACRASRIKAWVAKNPERSDERNRRYHLMKFYGLELDKFNEMIEDQNNKCPICKNELEETPRAKAVDHNHETGKIRSILCSLCNMGLGSFRDNEEYLRAAIDYLQKHKEVSNAIIK
jgi:Recombination endonuclease VII